MNDPMLPLPGLSPASGKPVVVKFDGGLLSSDGGVLALREVEQRLRLADRLAACIVDPRDPATAAKVKVGDYVQWTSNGVINSIHRERWSNSFLTAFTRSFSLTKRKSR